MLLKGEQLTAHLEREFRPLYIVWGDDPLLILEAADAIRAKSRQAGYTEREVMTVLPGFDWNLLRSAGSNLSLFGDLKLIELRVPTGKPGKEGSAALQDWCKHLSPETALLVILPELDWKEEKSAWFTALSQTGIAVKLTAPALAELPGWIAGRLRRHHLSADNESLEFMAERVEGNLLAAHQEIEKLALLYPAGPLTYPQVREAVLNVARYDIDTLRDALLAGETGRLARTLEGLRQEGEAAPLVLWAMSEEIRALCLIKRGQERGQPLDALFREAKVWGLRQGLLKRAAQRLSTPVLEAALRHAGRIDRLIKGIGKGDLWEEFLRLGMRLVK